jgi:TolB-like protein
MAALYVVAAWVIMQVAEVLMDLANLPDWIGPAVLGLLAVGFPISLIFSWFYELTPEGLSLEKDVAPGESVTHSTGRRLDFVIMSLLGAAVILFAWHTWWPSAPLDKSIAVLPFENMSGDLEQEYFSDGISEDLLNLLAQLPELRVAARTSSFQFKGQHDDIASIAKKLNVSHILEGSVRRTGNKIRITAQLVNADDGFHLWSGSYDRELDDIFAVQDEIAGAISDALKVELALVDGHATPPTVIKSANADAFDAYLRGREFVRLRGGQNLQDGIRHLQRSLRLDDEFAPAHAQLAIAIALLNDTPGAHGGLSLEEVKRRAVPHLDRAQELQADLAEANGGRALLAMFANDPASAIEHAGKALASNPSYIDAMNWMYMALGRLGRYQEAADVLERMLATDPLTIVGRRNQSMWLAVTGRLEEARQYADQLLVQSPGLGYSAHAEMSLVHEGNIAEGLSWALRAQDEEPADYTATHRVKAFIWVGEYDEARRISDELTHMVDIAEGRFEEAVEATQGRVQLEPERERAIAAAADVLYVAGRIDEALPLLERLCDFAPERALIGWESYDIGPTPWERTMRLALARRKAGDEEGAQAAAEIVRQNQAALRTAGAKYVIADWTDAVIAAFDGDPDAVVAALESGLRLSLRDPQFLDDAIFESMRDEPHFVALRQALETKLAVERDEVLQLVCFNNPTPDNWQPLPETCEGVEERRGS